VPEHNCQPVPPLVLQLTDACQKGEEEGEVCGVRGEKGLLTLPSQTNSNFLTPLLPLSSNIDYFKGGSIKLCL